MTLIFNSFAHFLVDAICVSTLFAAGAEGELLTLGVILYNTLAFSTQCLVGLLLDNIKHWKAFNLTAMLTVILGCLLPLPFLLRICAVGVGNSFFHVAAGTMTLRQGRGKARDLGVFVAPGAFGVTLGTCFPMYGTVLSILLILCTAAMAFLPDAAYSDRAEKAQCETRYPLLPILLLTAAVAVRAIGGSAAEFPWKSGAGAAFLMTAFVFLGKFLGGFVCDKIGAKRTALFSIPAAAVCIAFLSDYAAPSLVGQLLLNLSMPVTLWLLYLAMPDSPAFAFGLAASALWPGTIAGMLFHLTGPAHWCCILASFLFGLFAILFSVKKIYHIFGGFTQ